MFLTILVHCVKKNLATLVLVSYQKTWRGNFAQRFFFLTRGVILLAQKHQTAPGLPDGILSDQKYQFWINFGGSGNGRCWYIL
jgi:hypothetical protein